MSLIEQQEKREPQKNAKEHELIYKDEIYAIVGAAMEVANELGSGFLEAVYQEALAIEFEEQRIPFISQPSLEIVYKGRKLVKEYFPDFICFGKIIVEIKAIKQLTSIEEAQLLNYLKAADKPVGLLLNFGTPKLEWKRMVMTEIH
ncbi:MAG TPA: GxxExxY protein [Termitinemataceae bacterium]|uniref:GxxExxY protein n=1 Tax=Treponema sp. J25 TaxID=2094121 RepID=UPI0010430AA9|nr:GxxExxY protein [Treponema sp. J25]TCW61242.1 GxxExxY protein [Treponema sp. J25]HOJ99789.1 GxxExxY protein [Termitinemataceae bacterium]HOM23474.1 GxxExxY protein [Termitinemataceae bacterium]HPQ00012.1 GxxExxY protein [Termitinemataceae bacterium]